MEQRTSAHMRLITNGVLSIRARGGRHHGVVGATTPDRRAAAGSGVPGGGASDLLPADRPCHDRCDRARPERRFHSRLDEGRIRDLRGRRQAGHHVDDPEPWRTGHQPPRADAAAGRGASSCPRRGERARPRRVVSSSFSSTTCTCSFKTPFACGSCSDGSPRRSSTKAICSVSSPERPFGDFRRPDLRQKTARRGDRQDHGQRAEAE